MTFKEIQYLFRNSGFGGQQKSQTIKHQYQQTSARNICCYTSTYGATGVAERVKIENKK